MTEEAAEPPKDELPPIYELPHDAIDKWVQLPADKTLFVSINKPDLDELMLGLRRNSLAQIQLGDALKAATNNDKETANEHFILHQNTIRAAYSNFNRFIEAVMRKSGTTDV